MKQKLFTYSSILLLLLGLASCTQDESQMTDGVEGTPMIFTATGLDFAEVHSRATVDNDWQGIESVAVKIGDVVKEYTVNTLADQTSAQLTSEEPFLWPGAVPQTVAAWWPYTSGPDMPNVVVQADQSGAGFAQSDFIMADQTVTYGSTSLEFSHRTARITLIIKPSDTLKDGKAAVQFLNLQLEANGAPQTITPNRRDSLVYDALVVPQTIAKDKSFISVEVNNNTFYYLSPADVNLEAGKRYSYTLSINNDKLVSEGSTITDWDDIATEDPGYVVRADGTYVVYNAKGLYVWADSTKTNSSANCILANDIELPAGENNWTPVGPNIDAPYKGTFDGNGHSISGLTINLAADGVGFFGHVGTDGVVKNLIISDASVEGNNYVGGVAGYNQGSISAFISGTIIGNGTTGFIGGVTGVNVGMLTLCYANNVSVSGAMHYVGAIAGGNMGGISDCESTGDVQGNIYVGGIVGYLDVVEESPGFITACNSSASVRGESLVGGVVGGCGRTARATMCYFTGSVEGDSEVGGVAGGNYGILIACYSIGNVTGTTNIGVAIGQLKDTNDCSACYWAGDQTDGVGSIQNVATYDVQKVDGDIITWKVATDAMNAALPDSEWSYVQGGDANTPPTLQKKS